MGAITKILEQITALPISERLLVMEHILRSIREEQSEASFDEMELAAQTLLSDYDTDKELTVFTNIEVALAKVLGF